MSSDSSPESESLLQCDGSEVDAGVSLTCCACDGTKWCGDAGADTTGWR